MPKTKQNQCSCETTHSQKQYPRPLCHQGRPLGRAWVHYSNRGLSLVHPFVPIFPQIRYLQFHPMQRDHEIFILPDSPTTHLQVLLVFMTSHSQGFQEITAGIFAYLAAWSPGDPASKSSEVFPLLILGLCITTSLNRKKSELRLKME